MAHQPAKPQIHAYSLKLVIFLIFFLIHSGLSAQLATQLSTHSRKAKNAYVQAESAFYLQNYDNALESIEEALQKDPEFIEAWLLKAETLAELDQPEDAVKAYQMVLSLDSTFYLPVYLSIGELRMIQGKFSSSMDWFQRFLFLENKSKSLESKAMELFFRAKFADSLVRNPSATELPKPGLQINSPADEYINVVRIDGKQLLFTRKNLLSANTEVNEIQEQFFVSTKRKDDWDTAVPFQLMNIRGNHGALTFSVDGQQLLFSGCGWPGGKGSCDLYKSQYINGQWSDPEIFGARINSEQWDSQPALMPDGSEIIFASNRKGGFGGSDLYKSVLLEDGSWSAAVNLGNQINTEGNEMSPFVHPDGKSLYFSSDGQPETMGKSDLFLSRMDLAGRWSKPINVGYPVNSPGEEVNLIVSADASTAYVSSKRGGDSHFDIYAYKLCVEVAPAPVTRLEALVLDKKSSKLLNASYILTELSTLETIYKGQTLKDGQIILPLPQGKQYALHVESTGYLFSSLHFNMEYQNETEVFELIIEMEKLEAGTGIVLNNIFFDLNASLLKKESEKELNILFSMLQKNPDLKIEISGHTDSTGSHLFNQILSEQRAESVRQYLIKLGIDKNRITSRGYGSDIPVSSNESEEGRAKNRRTEMRILAEDE